MGEPRWCGDSVVRCGTCSAVCVSGDARMVQFVWYSGTHGAVCVWSSGTYGVVCVV